MKRIATSGLIGLLLAIHAFAWGPHPEITQAGLDALGADHPLVRLLGPEAAKLREYCWMADWRRTLRADYYPDDYLLFPAAPRHIEHECPAVRASYEPYFRRALQALRTETPPNAARWIGSILHFTEDTGAPPHAAEIKGDIHSKMENWIDGRRVRIDGYVPQLLGETDETATLGFVRRMEGLIQYSKERGLRLRPLVEAGDRKACEPEILECALESSRVVADLLHTLGTLSERMGKDGGTLRGTITSEASPGLEAIPAKVMLEGTLFSTLADASGVYEFRNLPAGPVRLYVMRAGSEIAAQEVTIERNGRHERNVTLRQTTPARNLVRNGRFTLHWVQPKAPDGWQASKDSWEGEAIPAASGTRLRLQAHWTKEAGGEVAIRWRESSAPYGPSVDEVILKPGEESRVVTVPEKMTHARILFRGISPAAAVESVSLTPVP